LLFACCWLLVVFVFPTGNRQTAISNVVLNLPFPLFTKEGQPLIFFTIRNQQPAIGKVFISPSPLSSPRRVEEIFFNPQSSTSNRQGSY